MYAFLLSAVPWKEIVVNTPMLMDVAAKLLDAAQRRGRSSPGPGTEGSDSLPKLRADIEQRLSELEKHELEQSSLISQMAAQEEALLRGMQALSTRVSILSWALAGTIAAVITAGLFLLIAPA